MNLVVLSGRLTRDPEIRYSGETTVARFDFAVNRPVKRDGEANADFFTCVAFKKTADVIEKHCVKGTKLLIEGEVRNNNYTDKNGNKVYGTQILVSSIEFCESKNQSDNNSGSNRSYTNNSNGDGFVNIPDGIDEELPFN